MRTFLLFTVVLFVSFNAQAQGLFKEQNQALTELLDTSKMPKNMNDYANIYFMKCMQSNNISELQPYMIAQCACTSAEIQKNMTFPQMEKLFNNRTRDDYYYTRFMTLAYVPCLRYSMHDLAYDLCKNKKSNSENQCKCVGKGVADHFSVPGAISLIPGYTGGGFSLTDTVDNPFVTVFAHDGVQTVKKYFMETCKGYRHN